MTIHVQCCSICWHYISNNKHIGRLPYSHITDLLSCKPSQLLQNGPEHFSLVWGEVRYRFLEDVAKCGQTAGGSETNPYQ